MYLRFSYQPHSTNPQGWDAYAETYAQLLVPDTVYSLTKEVIHKQITDHLASPHPIQVLDLNCGVGNDFPFFLAMGWQITACDGSVGMLNKAYEKYQAEIEAGQIALFLGQMETLDENSFPGLKFDLIFSVTGGYSYISDDKMRVVNEALGNYLTPDGLMVTAHLTKFCPSDIVYQLLHGKVKQAFVRWKKELKIQIKGQEFRMFLRGRRKVQLLTPPNLQTLKVLPLLWLTPPYQTGYKPIKVIYRLLKVIEMKTCNISMLSFLADQVVAVAKRRVKEVPGTIALQASAKGPGGPPGGAKLPNFIIAGAPKSGTTSLYHYLRQHPQVYLSPIKEPTFFAAADILSQPDLLPIIERQRAGLRAYLAGSQLRPTHFLVTEWNDYVQLFRDARSQIAIGEASVSYLWLPSAAAAIRSKLPEVRLIFVLRDPTERLFSLYLLNRKRDSHITFRDWVLKAMNLHGDRRQGVHRYPIPLDGGLYATQLGRFLDIFPRNQVRIYLYESYRADARAVLRDILAFLGVDPNHPIDMSHRHNETLVPRFPAMARLRQRILGNVPLIAWLPAPAGNALRKLYHRQKNSFVIDPDDRRMVIDYYRDEIRRTEDLIGTDLSAWLR
jgi:SAM-dependent methyltransferase